VTLYAISQDEHCHNGKLSQEIGHARELDLKAILHLYLGENFIYDIDNNCKNGADCLLYNPISIKHVGSLTGSVKAKWTSDETKAKAYMTQMLLLDPENYTHMLIVYIDMKKTRRIQIIGIAAEQIRRAVETLKEAAFTTRFGTNTRGVEYSKKLMETLKENKYFEIVINDVVFDKGMGPIERRKLQITTSII